MKFRGNIVVEGVRNLPASIKIGQPVGAVLSVSGMLDNLEALKLSQNLNLTPPGVSQSLTVTLSGLDRFLGRHGPCAARNGLKKLRGSIETSLKAAPGPGLSPYLQALPIQGLNVTGTAEAVAGLDFDGNGGIAGACSSRAPIWT